MKLRFLSILLAGACLAGIHALVVDGGGYPIIQPFPAALAQEDPGESEEPGEPESPKAKGKASKGDDDGGGATPEVKAKKKSNGGKAAASPETGKPVAGKAEGAKKKTSLDDQYVLDNIQKYLSPTKFEALPDGRVKLTFEFSEKKEEHETIFSPKISKEVMNIFRWSLPYEYANWWGTTGYRGEDGRYVYGALRISQQGGAHLNAFFTDDVEAEIAFANGSSTTAAQTVAVVFTSGTKSIGSNWGSQAATFESGKLKGRKGAVENAAMETAVRIKLVVRNGMYEAHRDGRQRQTEKYSPKTYASGRIGFIWGGGLAGFVYRLEITGRLDSKKMADVIRKQRK